MRQLRSLLGPTLVRRMIMTLLLSFAVVWLVLLIFLFLRSTDQAAIDDYQRNRGQILLDAIAQFDDEAQAKVAIAMYSEAINGPYKLAGSQARIVLQLEDRQGKRLYTSPEAGAFRLRGENGKFVDLPFKGHMLHVFRGETGRWIVLKGEPHYDNGRVIAKMSGDMTIYVLIAMPLVLLPAWFAAVRGLRPLRQLSDAIAARGPDDLAPLGIDARYAELTPVTSAIDRLLSQLRTKIGREHAFVQDAAHELRTPMAVIAAQAHVLIMAEGAESRALAGRQLEFAIARASHLVQQLLDLAHIDSVDGGGAETFDVARLLRQELAGPAQAAMARDVELSLEAPDALMHTMERHAFQSIAQNLISNAVRYVH